ncbi:MAG TPA: heme-binding protein [Polyangiaceae bacterium]|nr:heme-binding protein [Polyangiaceae bacterium]
MMPAPADPRVELRPVPERRVAALRFAGRFLPERFDRKGRELVEAPARAGLEARGGVEVAGYDPPGVLPFLRRNEVWIELAA